MPTISHKYQGTHLASHQRARTSRQPSEVDLDDEVVDEPDGSEDEICSMLDMVYEQVEPRERRRARAGRVGGSDGGQPSPRREVEFMKTLQDPVRRLAALQDNLLCSPTGAPQSTKTLKLSEPVHALANFFPLPVGWLNAKSSTRRSRGMGLP